jgi:hypothetical protein
MSPADLVDLCTTSIERWRSGGCAGSAPSILLVVPRTRCPSGETVSLFGRSGPRGRIANIRETPRGYDVVAYFPAAAVLEEIMAALRRAGAADA